MSRGFQKVVSFGVTSASLGDAWWSELEKLATNFVAVDDEEDLQSEITDADALLLSLGRGADKDLIEAAPKLRYIGMLGTGYGRIDLEAARAAEITVTNVADYSTEGVAEFVFGALLAELRELERAHQQAQSGDYDESSYDGTQLSAKTFGILGLGNIGRRVTEIAAGGFGSDVLVWSRSTKELGDIKGARQLSTPEEVLSKCNIISLHLEHNPDTDGFLGSDRLDQIADGAILINTAPMELIDLPSLETHLKTGRFSFIFDHSDEMKPEDVARLSRYDVCTVYPPIAYTTQEATEAKRKIFVTNITSFFDGGTQNVVS